MVLGLKEKFRFDNIGRKIEKHLKKFEADVSSQRNATLNEHPVGKSSSSSKLVAKLSLNFDFKFFKLMKCVFYDEMLISTESDLVKIMEYCLAECIQQFRLVKIQIQADEDDIVLLDEFDEDDELNMIELYV